MTRVVAQWRDVLRQACWIVGSIFLLGYAALLLPIRAFTPRAQADASSGIEQYPVSSAPARVTGGQTFLPFVSIAPTPTPRPGSCSTTPLAPIQWDPRLGPGGLAHLEGVHIDSAAVSQCYLFWRVVVVKFEDYDESGNDHTIYIRVIDESGSRVDGTALYVTSWGGLSAYPEEKPAWDMCNCNFNWPLFGDAYNVQIRDILPSDTMAGMVMPLHQHVNYRITFQRTLNPG